MQTTFTYFLILISSVAGPLALSFDRKVAFYKHWPALFRSMVLPVVVYIVWDVFFTAIGIWNFNPKYITGIYLGNLPLEEVLFFIIIPYCCVFIYACLRAYFPGWNAEAKGSWLVLRFIFILALLAGSRWHDRYYTAFTCWGIVLFGAWVLIDRKTFCNFHPGYFLVSYAIALLPFLLVNGFLTALPVVRYNDAENIGYRIYTIPAEDVFYGMLLMLMIIAGYEQARSRPVQQA